MGGGRGETYLCLDSFRASVGLFLKRACTLLSGLSCCSSVCCGVAVVSVLVLVLVSVVCCDVIVSVVFPICCGVAVVSVSVLVLVSVVCCDVFVELILAFNAAISGDM